MKIKSIVNIICRLESGYIHIESINKFDRTWYLCAFIFSSRLEMSTKTKLKNDVKFFKELLSSEKHI